MKNYILRKKGTKAVTGTVPFQIVHLFYLLAANMYILGTNIYL